MSNEIKVYPLKTKVKYGEELNLKGEITAITIREFDVIYEITSWKGDDLKTIWLRENYFRTATAKVIKKSIGFENEVS